jgi:membrane protease subunit HflC
MEMSKLFVLILLIISTIISLMSLFTVSETEVALKLRLGEVIHADYKPGIHFKVPIVERVYKFDKRIQTVNSKSEKYLTKEKKNLIVDSFIKWRIEDVRQYYTTMGGNEDRASNRLSEVVADGLRSQFGIRDIKEVVSGDRAVIMDYITKQASERAKEFGIQIVDVRIKKIELPKEVSAAVYKRMRTEREQVAEDWRQRGKADAQRIRAEADRESVEIVAVAEREAEIVRGLGDATASQCMRTLFRKILDFTSFIVL